MMIAMKELGDEQLDVGVLRGNVCLAGRVLCVHITVLHDS